MTLSNRARFSSKGLNILFVIPAREGSQRLIGKNYKKIKGKSLLKLKIDNCKKSCLGNIVVTSDCPIILDQAKKYEVDFIRKRPKSLTGDGPSTPIVYDAVRFYERKSKSKADIIILSQLTTPFVFDKDFKDSLNIFIKFINKYKSLIACKEIDNNISWNIYEDIKGNSFKLSEKINSELKNFLVDKKIYIPNGGIYMFHREHLNKKGSLYLAPTKIFKMTKLQSIDIDYEEDLKLAKIIGEEILSI